MRYGPSFRVLALLAAVTLLGACAKEAAEMPDSAAAAAAAAPPPPDAFTLVSKDGSWSGEITPSGITYSPKGKETLSFEYKAPTLNGAISDYESLMTAKDTIRIAISLAMTSCTDAAGGTYTHMAQVWLTGRQGGRDLNTQTQGCANKK